MYMIYSLKTGKSIGQNSFFKKVKHHHLLDNPHELFDITFNLHFLLTEDLFAFFMAILLFKFIMVLH